MSHFVLKMCIFKCKVKKPQHRVVNTSKDKKRYSINKRKGGNNYEKRIIKGFIRGANQEG